jgi:hypothetical protein
MVVVMFKNSNKVYAIRALENLSLLSLEKAIKKIVTSNHPTSP